MRLFLLYAVCNCFITIADGDGNSATCWYHDNSQDKIAVFFSKSLLPCVCFFRTRFAIVCNDCRWWQLRYLLVSWQQPGPKSRTDAFTAGVTGRALLKPQVWRELYCIYKTTIEWTQATTREVLSIVNQIITAVKNELNAIDSFSFICFVLFSHWRTSFVLCTAPGGYCLGIATTLRLYCSFAPDRTLFWDMLRKII